MTVLEQLIHLLNVIEGAAAAVGSCAACGGEGARLGQACEDCDGEGLVSAAAAFLRVQEAAKPLRARHRPPMPQAASPQPETDTDSWMDGQLGPPVSTWDVVRSRIKNEGLVPAGVWIERDIALGRYVAFAEAEPQPVRCDGDYDLVANATRFVGKRFCVVAWSKEGDRLVGYRHAPINLKSLKLA